MPLDFSLDHMGPLARTAQETGIVLQEIAGFDPRDDTSSRQPLEAYGARVDGALRGKRIGVPQNFYNERLQPEVSRAFQGALNVAESEGARLVPIRVPDPAEINAVSRVILLSEASALMEPYLHRRADFGADVLALLDQGRFIAATDYVNAQRLRAPFPKGMGANMGKRGVHFHTNRSPHSSGNRGCHRGHQRCAGGRSPGFHPLRTSH